MTAFINTFFRRGRVQLISAWWTFEKPTHVASKVCHKSHPLCYLQCNTDSGCLYCSDSSHYNKACVLATILSTKSAWAKYLWCFCQHILTTNRILSSAIMGPYTARVFRWVIHTCWI